MGLYDSFYDEDSKCPKCQRKIDDDWQTKRLESLMGSWHRGDFFRYAKWEAIPEEERKSKYGDRLLAPFLRKTGEYLSSAPLMLNGYVPVHNSCGNCHSWLEAYAKITNGRFEKIIEAEATREEKELVTIPKTAKLLREKFEKKLAHLQESCNHERSKWTRIESAPCHGNRQTLVCQRCDKILETKNLQEDEVLTNLARLRGKGSLKKHVRPRLKGSPAEVDVHEIRRKASILKKDEKELTSLQTRENRRETESRDGISLPGSLGSEPLCV